MVTSWKENEFVDVLIPQDDIKKRIEDLGKQISEDYKGKQLHLLGILRGSFVFMSDLVRAIDLPLTVDFMALSSYGDSTKSSGVVQFVLDLGLPIEDKEVLVVEDIIDSGLTMHYLLQNLRTRNPNSVKVCTLLSKPARRKVEVPIDYIGFEIPDEFVVGYGLDYAQRYRNLPFIGKLRFEEK